MKVYSQIEQLAVNNNSISYETESIEKNNNTQIKTKGKLNKNKKMHYIIEETNKNGKKTFLKKYVSLNELNSKLLQPFYTLDNKYNILNNQLKIIKNNQKIINKINFDNNNNNNNIVNKNIINLRNKLSLKFKENTNIASKFNKNNNIKDDVINNNNQIIDLQNELINANNDAKNNNHIISLINDPNIKELFANIVINNNRV